MPYEESEELKVWCMNLNQIRKGESIIAKIVSIASGAVTVNVDIPPHTYLTILQH